MRAALLVAMSVIVVAALGWAGCTAMGRSVHPREFIAAAFTCLIAGELAAVPLILARSGTQGTVAQAALVGTFIHLMANLGAAAVVLIGKLGLDQAYVYWLMAFYWTSLAVLVMAFTQAIKAAPVEQAQKH